MKKTLTVNLGGTVFHIDEDAYRLLDNYLSNLRLHFRKQEGAEEIVNDIEIRISELFSEKIGGGSQVITIVDVEEVIARMGKPEDFAGNEEEEPKKASAGTTFHHRLYRNPDNKMLGGVASGLAAYLGWDVTLVRFLLIVIMVCGYGIMIPIYIVCWIVIPEAHTAAEKLSMHGEDVTIENIGKTVTDGFEKVANGVNDYVKSGKPRTFLQKLGDVLVGIVGFFLKACLILLALVFSPVLFVLALVFIVLIIAIVAVAIGGSTALFQLMPAVDWSPIMTVSPAMAILGSLSGIALVCIPLIGIVYAIFCSLLNWSPMSSGLKWALTILWIVAMIVFVFSLSVLGWPYPFMLVG